MPQENKARIQEDEREVEENAEEFGRESEESKQKEDKPEERSFADDDQQRDPQAENEEFQDLSMFERDLRLPEEGAMCVDTNLQAAKYMIIYLMKRVQKGINTWLKFNITTSRKEKLRLWREGFRPEVTGKEYPVKDVDPLSGEPKGLKGLEYLTWMRNHGKFREYVDGGESIIVCSYYMQRFLHKLRWAIYRIGMNQADLNAMIVHNKNQTDQQKAGRAWLDNENCSLYIPQLQYAPQQPLDTHGKGTQGSDHRPKRKGKSKSSKAPIVYAPGGKSYDLPPQDRADSSQVGASAKAHAAKARPEGNRPQPPDPPPSRRMQEEREEDTTYAVDQVTTNEPGQSAQQPIDPEWTSRGRGRGRGQQWDRDDRWGHRGRGGGKGYQRQYQGGWEYRGWY